MDAIIFKSFAKLNLFLHVLGKRADGYHDLDGVMTGISIYDTIRIERAKTFSLTCDMLSLANENNLAIRAAKIYFETAYESILTTTLYLCGVRFRADLVKSFRLRLSCL